MHAGRYIHALGSVPVHMPTLMTWLRTRAKWLRLDAMRDVGGTSSLYPRVGGPYATPDMAAEAARHARDLSGVPIGVSAPASSTDSKETNSHVHA